MKFTVFTAIMVLTVLLFTAPSPALAQGNFSLIIEGIARSEVKFIGLSKSADLNNMEFKNPIITRVGIRFNQDGRIAFGAGYEQYQLLGQPEHFVAVRGPLVEQFPELLPGVFSPANDPNGPELASFRLRKSAEVRTITGTMYVNLLTRGNVRPFVGLGGGVSFAKVTYAITDMFVDPEYDFEFDFPSSYSIDSHPPEFHLLGGVNFFPVKNMVLSFAGGYANKTGEVSFGAGVTF